MSIYSMTGFSRTETDILDFEVTCELKSVNNRFKDFKFRTPHILNQIELDLKKLCEKYISRGSLDINIHIKRKKSQDEFSLDFNKINSFLKVFKENVTSDYILNPTHFLKNEFYQDADKSKEETLFIEVKKVFEETLKKLQLSRENEGKGLLAIMLENTDLLESHLGKINEYKKSNKDKVESKLKEKLQERNIELEDDQRLYKEIIFYLEKLDIDEETDRAKIHIDKLKANLASSGVTKGREIEFTLQELNREVNTIGSKSHHEKITESVIKCKSYLEKMREQALNIQ